MNDGEFSATAIEVSGTIGWCSTISKMQCISEFHISLEGMLALAGNRRRHQQYYNNDDNNYNNPHSGPTGSLFYRFSKNSSCIAFSSRSKQDSMLGVVRCRHYHSCCTEHWRADMHSVGRHVLHLQAFKWCFAIQLSLYWFMEV